MFGCCTNPQIEEEEEVSVRRPKEPLVKAWWGNNDVFGPPCLARGQVPSTVLLLGVIPAYQTVFPRFPQ